MIVLDTDVVTLSFYGKNQKLNNRLENPPEGEELAISVITYVEILGGRFDSIKTAENGEALLKAMERFQQSRTALHHFLLVEINEAAASHFQAMLTTKRKPRTKKMRRGDMLIACIALAHNALLVTRNVEDYRGVKDLRVENWAD